MYGSHLRVTHAGLNSSSILIGDLDGRTDGPAYEKTKVAVYVPVGGYIDLPLTQDVVLSYENGSIRSFITNGYVTASLRLGQGAIDALPPDKVRIPSSVVANGTVIERFWAPYDITILGIHAYLANAAVTAGTYTLAVENAADGTNLLADATFDLTTVDAGTPTEVALSGTSADLEVDGDEVVEFTFASNNADLTAAGLIIQCVYKRRV